MEIKEVPYRQKPESDLLLARCEHCGHVWHPFEDEGLTLNLPCEVELDCPKCKKVTLGVFLDDETKKAMMYKKYVLGYEENNNRLKKQVETLTKELNEWKEKYNEKIKNNEKLIDILDRLVKKLEEFGVQIEDSDKKFQHFG